MILESRHPAPTIPDVTLSEFVRGATGRFADKPAFIDGPSGRLYTYRQLGDLSASVAHALIARGIRAGDRVAFLCPNLPEVAIAYHGVMAAGAVAMMLNPLSTADELTKYFAIGKPAMAVTIAPLLPALRAAAPSLPVVVIGEGEGVEPLAALFRESTTPPPPRVGPDDLAVMPYSSGTTGFPKGVMLTQRNLIAQSLCLNAVQDGEIIGEGAPVLAVLPFFHIYGIVAYLTYGLVRGATMITMPRFDLEQYLQLARTYEIPQLHVVPPILLGITKYPGDLQLPKLQAALSGAAPLGADLAAEFTKRTSATVYQVYGMTEVTGASHLGSRDPARNKPGSIGALIPGVQAKLVDGEIWLRGPIVMKGYFEDEKATRETIDADGWLHTGDIARVDEDGDFFIVDRVKELIKYKSLQVAPAELESVLLSHDAVADVAVYPMPDVEAGEIPKAAVVLKPGRTASAEELMAFVQERVSPQKRVRAVRFVAQIPKSASGKILRRVLRAEDTSSSPT